MARFVYYAVHFITIAVAIDINFVSAEEPTISDWTFRGDDGRDCTWVAEVPERRCHRIDRTHDWIRLCSVCPDTCNAAGFEEDNCYPLRSISDIRFNKLPPVDDLDPKWIVDSEDYAEGVHYKLYPIMPNQYPLNWTSSVLKNLVMTETLADSVVITDDYELKDRRRKKDSNIDIYSSEYWLTGESALSPILPGEDDYWVQLEQVVDMQLARIANTELPREFQGWPKRGADYQSVAAAVRNEYPAFHQQVLITELLHQGLTMRGPERSRKDTLGSMVRLADINTWAYQAVAPITFMLKWEIGKPRPEEMVWLINRGEFNSKDVPQNLVKKIKSMKMQTSTDFTAYSTGSSKGSPNHPSWPSMHSTGSNLSTWLPIVANLSAQQYCECLRTDYSVSHARAVAGVNYPQDIIDGLNIGMRIIQEKLPSYLAAKYGDSEADVRKEVEQRTFDWKDFDFDACTIRDIPVGEFLKKRRPVPRGVSC